MFTRLLLFLLLPLAARADLKWAATIVFSSATPAESRATAQFTFVNTGTSAIRILGAKTTCGCTAAVADSRSIAPGQTGRIDVSFKTLNRRGLYEEPIVVKTDDPGSKETTVTLRVLIRDAVELLPALLFWQPGEALTPKTIQVNVTDGFNVKDVTAASSSPDIDIHMEPVKPGAYKVTVIPKTQHVKATISITPTSPDKPLRVLTAHIRVS